jgi:NodT family efflux transporter outer membrane factor (OMF) lipoprotein
MIPWVAASRADACRAATGLRHLVIAALLLPMAACKVGPDFAKPVAPVADKWLEAGNASVISDRQDYRNWWTLFDDPTLNRLIDIAYRQNLTLMAAGTRVLEARAALGIAIGEFYPQTQKIGGSVTYNQASKVDPTSNPNNQLGDYWRASLRTDISWELDLWGKFRRGVQSADAAYLASIATYDDVLVTLLADVATTYIGIRTLQNQIDIAQQNVVKQRKALEIARDRFKGGVATGLDVYQAQNVLAQTESTIPQLTAQLQQGEDALRILLGMTPASLNSLLAGPENIPVPPKDVAVGIPADLLRRRPDIRSAELEAAAQSEQIGIAEADLFPAFSLSGAFGSVAGSTGSNHVGELFTAYGITFAFGPTFSWPVLNYGQITNNVRVQDAHLQTLLIDYKNAVLKARQEVEDGLSGFLQGRKQVDLLHDSVTAANNALSIATDQYLLGTRDFTTVLTAEQNLYQAENSLVSAAGSVSTSLTSVYRSLGGGWQIRQGNDFVNDATRTEMVNRTNWGSLLPPAGEQQPPTPGLPGPDNIGPDIRPPEW